MARVYIGSISSDVREDQIKTAFSVFGPIKSVNFLWEPTGRRKEFAFLEYEVPEAALLAQETMNGKMMAGRCLKVDRPSNVPQAQPIIEMVQQEAKKYYRVYVASVHPDLTETDLRSVFEAFGKITKCQLAKQPHGRGHRGFGYLEFTTAMAVKEAIEGMNNFDLGGQFLQVGRCITPPEALTYLVPSSQSALPTAAVMAAATISAKIQAQEALSAKTGSPFGNASPVTLPGYR
jgi:half-pint family poly-U binding splicing factor